MLARFRGVFLEEKCRPCKESEHVWSPKRQNTLRLLAVGFLENSRRLCKEREYVRKVRAQNTLHALFLSCLSCCEHGVRACRTLACLSTWLSVYKYNERSFKAYARDALAWKSVVTKPHSKWCSSEVQRGNALIGCGLSGLLHMVPVTTAAMLSDIGSNVE